MTTSQFLEQMEAYYGDYREAVRAYVTRYLDQGFADSEKNTLRDRVFNEYSSTHRSPPDISVLRRASVGMIPPELPMETFDITDEERRENIVKLRKLLTRWGMAHLAGEEHIDPPLRHLICPRCHKSLDYEVGAGFVRCSACDWKPILSETITLRAWLEMEIEDMKAQTPTQDAALWGPR